jgi:hypothetical protein
MKMSDRIEHYRGFFDAVQGKKLAPKGDDSPVAYTSGYESGTGTTEDDILTTEKGLHGIVLSGYSKEFKAWCEWANANGKLLWS